MGDRGPELGGDRDDGVVWGVAIEEDDERAERRVDVAIGVGLVAPGTDVGAQAESADGFERVAPMDPLDLRRKSCSRGVVREGSDETRT